MEFLIFDLLLWFPNILPIVAWVSAEGTAGGSRRWWRLSRRSGRRPNCAYSSESATRREGDGRAHRNREADAVRAGAACRPQVVPTPLLPPIAAASPTCRSLWSRRHAPVTPPSTVAPLPSRVRHNVPQQPEATHAARRATAAPPPEPPTPEPPCRA
jgi:hypothetical protein